MNIHVIQPTPPVRPQPLGRPRAYNPRLDQVRTGNLTYSGVVFRLNGQRVVLHTRAAGDLAILLRQDTRYLENGGIVDSASLKPNMRVFVRAGKVERLVTEEAVHDAMTVPPSTRTLFRSPLQRLPATPQPRARPIRFWRRSWALDKGPPRAVIGWHRPV